MPTDPKCKHEHGFRPYNPEREDMPCCVWVCKLGCGYWINFDPENYKFGVAFLCEPSPNIEWKRPPELKSSEVGK